MYYGQKHVHPVNCLRKKDCPLFVSEFTHLHSVPNKEVLDASEFLSLFLYYKVDLLGKKKLYKKAALTLGRAIGIDFRALDRTLAYRPRNFGHVFYLDVDTESWNLGEIISNLLRIRQNFINALGSEPVGLIDGQLWVERDDEFIPPPEKPYLDASILRSIRTSFHETANCLVQKIRNFDEDFLALLGQRAHRKVSLEKCVQKYSFPKEKLCKVFLDDDL